MHQKPLLVKTETAPDQPPDFVIRAADIADLSDFLELAMIAGAGFTSLPANEALLAERLLASKPAFAGRSGALILALEDLNAGRVIGCAAIKAGGAAHPDFLNFLVDDDQQTLSPTTLYGGLTEVGSLLIHPDYRRFGVGRWLAQSRYLVIAGDLCRFGRDIFSELRGVIDDDNHSPFYDAVLAPHFGLAYEEADHRSAHGRQAELNALLPAAPIRLQDLGKAALASIGSPHRDGRKALLFLEDEGFQFEGAVDLLDGGPLVVAPSRSISTIRTARAVRTWPGEIEDEEASAMILAAGDGADFRSVKGPAIGRAGSIVCPPGILERARLAPGGLARVCPDRQMPERRTALSLATARCHAGGASAAWSGGLPMDEFRPYQKS